MTRMTVISNNPDCAKIDLFYVIIHREPFLTTISITMIANIVLKPNIYEERMQIAKERYDIANALKPISSSMLTYMRLKPYKQDWVEISLDYRLTFSLMKEFQKFIIWSKASVRQSLSYKAIDHFAKILDWQMVSRFQYLPEWMIRKHSKRVEWKEISRYQRLSEPFIKVFENKVDWGMISAFQPLSMKFIWEYVDEIEPELIFQYQSLNEKDIAELMTYFRTTYDKMCIHAFWNSISWHSNLSEKFIETFKNELNWYGISHFQKLSEEFIEMNSDRVNWLAISKQQELSSHFIWKFQKRVSMPIIDAKHIQQIALLA